MSSIATIRRFLIAAPAAAALLVTPPSAAAAFGQSASASGAAVDRELQAVYDRFSEAYRRRDASMVAALYTEDALYLQPDSEIRRGRAAVREIFAGFLEQPGMEPGSGPEITFEIVDRTVSGDLAYDVGYYTIRPQGVPAAGGPGGKFIVIWKRGADGAWRIHADGFSAVRR